MAWAVGEIFMANHANKIPYTSIQINDIPNSRGVRDVKKHQYRVNCHLSLQA